MIVFIQGKWNLNPRLLQETCEFYVAHKFEATSENTLQRLTILGNVLVGNIIFHIFAVAEGNHEKKSIHLLLFSKASPHSSSRYYI